MIAAVERRPRDRIVAAIGVALLHLALAYALVLGLGFDRRNAASDGMKLFDVRQAPLPPPVKPDRPRERDRGAEAPAAAARSPVIAPPAKIRFEVPPRIAAATESGAEAGAATSGAGSGAGGIGSGTGSGAAGAVAVRARLLKGRITGSDYPRDARLARAEGTVFVRFAVGAHGRASNCIVTRSSGNTQLDATTCRLIERRFRYSPARDARGQAISDVVIGSQRWWFSAER